MESQDDMRIMLRTVKFETIPSTLLKISTKERLELKGSDQLKTKAIQGKFKGKLWTKEHSAKH